METSSSTGGINYEFSNASGQWAWSTLSATAYKGPFRSTFLVNGEAVTLYGQAGSGLGELFDTAVWTGGSTWQQGSFVLPDYNASYFALVGPVPTVTGAGVAYQEQVLTDAGTVDLFAVYSDFDPTQSEWDPDNALSLAISDTAPALAATAAGNPLLVVVENETYSWTLRTGTTWSAPAAVPGIAAPLDCPNAPYVEPAIAAMARTGVGEILAVFVSCGAHGGYSLESATFSSGAWTTPITFADSQPWQSVSLSLASLPDGRIALATNAKTTEDDGGAAMICSLGFWDGTSWSAFRTAETERYNVSLVAGVGGAVLELFSTGEDLNSNLFHSRLMDDTAWTWSEGVVDSANFAWSYAAASRP